jgi:hypothetical protein
MAAPTSAGIGIDVSCRHLGVSAHRPCAPVDILKHEGRDLVGPQTEPGEQQQDGVVAPSQRRRSIAPGQNLLNLHAGRRARQIAQLPSPNGRHAVGQLPRVRTAAVEVAQKGAQGPTHGLARRRACVPGVALDVADDIRVSNLAEIAGAGGTDLSKKPPNARFVAKDRPRCQPLFTLQIIGKLRENYLIRRHRRRCCRRNCLRVSQGLEQAPRCGSVAQLDRLLATSVPQVALDHVLIEPSKLQAVAG